MQAVHEFQQEIFKQDYSDYNEEDPVKIESKGFGEGRRSIFTAKKGIFSKVKGYRATFLANDYSFQVYCYVPEKQFDQFEPIFKKMIDSVTR